MQEIKVFRARDGYYAQLGTREFLFLGATAELTHSLLCSWGAKRVRGFDDAVAGTYVVRREQIPA